MTRCDVLIVGGGPAGSACAWGLRRSGLDVVIADRARFPRDKVCAGWITPQVLEDLQLDPEDYRRGRTLQPITGFRVGLIGGGEPVETSYARPVSFGIRRCEFDEYLLRRAGARLLTGQPVLHLRRDGTSWVVNGSLAASVIVGAGGHFCPVRRALTGGARRGPLVVAQEAEQAVTGAEASACRVAGERPELYFSRDLTGYGWCFRKGDHLNVGYGELEGGALPGARAAFVDFLVARGRIPGIASWPWRGHAYLLAGPGDGRLVDDGALLAGDAAGLAYPQSGEGIRPAIESGLLAAAAIAAANGRYTRERLAPYEDQVRARFGSSALAHRLARVVPASTLAAAGRRLIGTTWFVRRVVLDRWFLHARDRARPTP